MSISGNPHKEHSQMLFDKNLGTAKNQSEPEELLTFGNLWRKEGDQIFLIT